MIVDWQAGVLDGIEGVTGGHDGARTSVLARNPIPSHNLQGWAPAPC
jgi:hypothetical protein